MSKTKIYKVGDRVFTTDYRNPRTNKRIFGAGCVVCMQSHLKASVHFQSGEKCIIPVDMLYNGSQKEYSGDVGVYTKQGLSKDEIALLLNNTDMFGEEDEE